LLDVEGVEQPADVAHEVADAVGLAVCRRIAAGEAALVRRHDA
jgi:hypothetical protein